MKGTKQTTVLFVFLLILAALSLKNLTPEKLLPSEKLKITPISQERPKVGISSMVIKDGKVLLGKRRGSHGAAMWATPGGHLEYGESVEACAKRELLEETGLTATSFITGPYTNDLISPENKHYVTLFVFVTDFEGDLQCLEPNKCEGWEWFAWDAFPSPLLAPLQSLIAEFGIENLKQLSE